MKSRFAWIYVVFGTGMLACSFDRSPLFPPELGESTQPARAWTFWDSDPKLTADSDGDRAGVGTGRQEGSSEGKDAAVDASMAGADRSKDGTGGEDRADRTDGRAGADDLDGGPGEEMVTEPPPKPIQCGGQFCPLAEQPAKACCTSSGDMERYAARVADACGVDLVALEDGALGNGCWQRDQLGIIDPRCPERGGEPGCCADDGLCGTSNTAKHLGCYHPPGAELRSCRQDMDPPIAMCDPRGKYALRVTVDAAWEGRDSGLMALTDDGRGPIEIYLLINVGDVDAETHQVATSGRLCGVRLPQFYSSTLCETYQPVFPDSLWESDKLPVPALGGSFECAEDGCVMSILPTTYVFGIRLENPEASWPTAQQTPYLRCPEQPNNNCFVDDDGDGEPGVTVHVEPGGTIDPDGSCRLYAYNSPPLNASIGAIFGSVRRADRLHVGIRARVGGSVRFGAGCETAAGSALVQYVNSRAKGCYVLPGTAEINSRPAGPQEPCTRTEAQFIDDSMPEYRVLGAGETPGTSRSNRDDSASPGPTVSVVRFPADSTPGCADVRQAAF